MSYDLAPEAEQDLADASDYYLGEAGAAVALSFLARFEKVANLLVLFPSIGTKTSKGRRWFPLGDYPYSVLYREHDGVLRISAVFHQMQRPRHWQRREP
ncbi:MAG: type II toxin-antitoxin system RelE/ParE family toxin [Rhodocyclaceae bacterium]|nr:type II toxin-antitoxin system RelE/ParE family toxin [Rhodocyclaceae bacterium]